jgi:hypothetical protein
LTHIFEEFLPSLWRDLRYYTGLALDYTRSGQYGYQADPTRDIKNGIEALGRSIFGTGNFYDCTKTA